MNTKLIDAIAKAVLYEGYMLYPYRPSSVKNRQRFNFGVLYPKSYAESQAGSDLWSMQTECIIEGASSPRKGKAGSPSRGVRFLDRVAPAKHRDEEPVGAVARGGKPQHLATRGAIAADRLVLEFGKTS